MNILPFQYSGDGLLYKRLLVEPILLPEVRTEDGLIIPARELPGSQLGRVFQTHSDSDFTPGDEVQYMKVDRASNESMDTVSIDGKVYDVIYEQKIWAVNDKPYNQMFVRPTSELEVSEGGLVLSSDVQSVSRKGIVVASPPYFDIKEGDRVEYQNAMQGFFPQASIEGELCDVIFQSDVFMVNDKVAPHRIIVKIDRVQQGIKRSSTQSGLALSPLFIAMLRNLQYGEVTGIGKEAKKLYPEVSVGDTIIFDHGVESQDYRVIKYNLGKERNAIYEHRVINCYDFGDQEVFGKLHYNKETSKIIDITPLGGAVFMKWNFELFDGSGDMQKSTLFETEDSLSNYHDLDALKNVVSHKRKDAAEKAKLKVSGIKQAIAYLDKEKHTDRLASLQAELRTIEQEEGRISAYLRKDYWVACDTIFPMQVPRYILSPYEELYPINLLGQKYLIGRKDFLLFQTHTNMNIHAKDLIALSDNVLVLPIEEKEAETSLVIPDSAKEKPKYGTVVKIGDNPSGVKEGDFILFRQHAGFRQEIDGLWHLVMKQNDLLAVVPAEAINS